jgi:hypothetical protein
MQLNCFMVTEFPKTLKIANVYNRYLHIFICLLGKCRIGSLIICNQSMLHLCTLISCYHNAYDTNNCDLRYCWQCNGCNFQNRHSLCRHDYFLDFIISVVSILVFLFLQHNTSYYFENNFIESFFFVINGYCLCTIIVVINRAIWHAIYCQHLQRC